MTGSAQPPDNPLTAPRQNPGTGRSAPPRQFAPRASDGLEGVLHPAGPALGAEALRERLLPGLTDLVRLAIDWPTDEVAPDDRIGDYRFLVVEFTPSDGVLRYVQIWSEPDSELLMEVGPGRREDARLQAVADFLAPALHGRGFAIGGDADNFRKELSVPRIENAPALAAELMALLTDVLGCDGSVDLAYQLRQSTFLEGAWVTNGMARSGLKDLLKAWGLSATLPSDTPESLDARSHGFGFRVQLHALQQGKKATYREIHVFAELPIARERVPDLLKEVNNRLWLMKAWAQEDTTDPTRSVRFATGINLAGGITLAHIKSHLFEWLETVQHFWEKWRTPAATSPEPPFEIEQHTVH